MSLKVADLSNNNYSKDLKNYPADGYMFKATEGTYFVDRFCDGFINQAKRKKKVWGVYHFISKENPEKQADFFYKNCKGYIHKGVLCLDYEGSGALGVNHAKRFLDRLYKLTGVRALIYMNVSTMRNGGNWTSVAKNHGLWLAYPSSSQYLPTPKYWKQVTMLQHSWSPYDKDIFFGTFTAWNKIANPKNKKTNDTKVTKPKVKKRYYTVKKNDTLSGIGMKLGVNWKTIAKKNNIKKPYVIYPNQKLEY